MNPIRNVRENVMTPFFLDSYKTKLESSKKSQQEKDQTIKQLNEKLASASSDSLLFQEHDNKLKADIKTLRTEKSQLVEKLTQNTGNIDTIEHKIESEVGELRDALMSEILQIKEQVKKSADLQSKMSSGTSTTQKDKDQTKLRNPTNQGTVRSSAPSSQLSKSKSVFIAGDDMTGNLSSRLMSSNDMSVKIKTHREGRIETIENSLVKLSEENRNYLTNLNAIILHAGAGNITDAYTPDSIVNGLKDAAETIHNVNPEARIIISSILPRRNDRITNTVISETNHALKDVCQEQDYVFIDNDKVFLKDGRPDVSLYRDPLNLNKKGGKFLGQNMQEILHKTLHLQPNPQRETRQSPHLQREARQYPNQDFRFPPNNRQADQQNRMMPPWMPSILSTMVPSSTPAISSGLEIDTEWQTHSIRISTNSLCSISQTPNDSFIQAPIVTDNYRTTDREKTYISEKTDSLCQYMEYTNDSSILHESCLFNNSLSEALNSNNNEILPNLSVCSNDFLEAQISITEQTAQIETSDFEYVHNIQLPANTSKEVWFENKGMHIMQLNIHYLYSKLDEIKILLSQQPNIDILCFCETFLNDQFHDTELSLDNYQLFRKDRKTNGGGLAIYIKDSLNCTLRDDLQVDGIEALLLEVKPQKQKPFLLAYTYRPPSSTQGWTVEFEQVLENLYSENKEIILIGDLNINLLDTSTSVQNWLQIIDSVNLTQLVQDPTRVTGTSSTLIDHAYSNRAENIIDVYVPCYAISDHYPVCLTRKLSHCKASEQGHKTITYRAMNILIRINSYLILNVNPGSC